MEDLRLEENPQRIADLLNESIVEQGDIVCALIGLSRIVATAKKLQLDLFRTVAEQEERLRRVESDSMKHDLSEIVSFQVAILKQMKTIEVMINASFPMEKPSLIDIIKDRGEKENG